MGFVNFKSEWKEECKSEKIKVNIKCDKMKWVYEGVAVKNEPVNHSVSPILSISESERLEK